MTSEKNIPSKVKDYLVSGEEFNLVYDKELDMLVTFPQPKPEELSKYYKSEEYISHTDSGKTFTEKIYQKVKRFALGQKVTLIKKENKETGKLLDIGAGTGDFLAAAKSKNWQVFGVEPSEEARELSQKKNIFLQDDISKITETNFDVITMWHVLEHVPNPENYIAQIQRKLKPGGTLIIAVPNFKSYDAKHYKQFWAAYDVPRHLSHFSKTSVKRIFEKKGFSLKKIKPMYFDSFYVSLLSEKYKTGKQNWLKAIYFGLLSNLSGLFTKEYSSHIYILKNKKLAVFSPFKANFP